MNDRLPQVFLVEDRAGDDLMESFDGMKSFLSPVDSIPLRFMASLITGKRDHIFRPTAPKRKFESES